MTIAVTQNLPMFARVEVFGGKLYDVAFVAPAEICGIDCLSVTARIYRGWKGADAYTIATAYYGRAAIFSLIPVLPSEAVQILGNEGFREIVKLVADDRQVWSEAGTFKMQAISQAHARD